MAYLAYAHAGIGCSIHKTVVLNLSAMLDALMAKIHKFESWLTMFRPKQLGGI